LSVGREATDVIDQKSKNNGDRVKEDTMFLSVNLEAIDVISRKNNGVKKESSTNQQNSEIPLIGPSAIYVQQSRADGYEQSSKGSFFNAELVDIVTETVRLSMMGDSTQLPDTIVLSSDHSSKHVLFFELAK